MYYIEVYCMEVLTYYLPDYIGLEARHYNIGPNRQKSTPFWDFSKILYSYPIRGVCSQKIPPFFLFILVKLPLSLREERI